MKQDIKDIKFDHIIDLYNRVKPALNSKIKELQRENYNYIKKEDIWNYLIKNKWSKANGLVLCDIVDDILHADNEKIDEFVKVEHQKNETIVEELDLI